MEQPIIYDMKLCRCIAVEKKYLLQSLVTVAFVFIPPSLLPSLLQCWC